MSKRGWTYPGYKYLGPFNSLDRGKPVNALDQAAQDHDIGYQELQEQGVNPYLNWNTADDQFLDNIRDDDGSLPAKIARGLFGIKKHIMPAVPGDKRTADGVAKSGGAKEVDMSSSETELNTSAESMDYGFSTGAEEGGGQAVGGGAAGVSKPAVSTGYKIVGNKLICWQTRRFSCMNKNSSNDGTMKLSKGRYIAADADMDCVTAANYVAGRIFSSASPHGTPASTSAPGNSTTSANNTETNNTTSPTPTATPTTTVTVSNATTTNSTTNATTTATPTNSTTTAQKICEKAKQKTATKRRTLYAAADKAYEFADPTPEYPGPEKLFKAPPGATGSGDTLKQGNTFFMYSCVYDWHYVDWNRFLGIVPPQAVQFLLRDCTKYRPTMVSQQYHGFQCVTESTINGVKVATLVPYGAMMCAERGGGTIPWVTIGQRKEVVNTATKNMWGELFHWPKDPIPMNVVPLRALCLQSSRYPIGVDDGTHGVWNPPLMENGSIEFITQVDGVGGSTPLNCTWIDNSTFSDHLLDMGKNAYLDSESVIKAYISGDGGSMQGRPDPFTVAPDKSGDIAVMRLSRINSWKEQNVMSTTVPNLVREGTREATSTFGLRDPQYGGTWGSSTSDTARHIYSHCSTGKNTYTTAVDTPHSRRRGLITHSQTRQSMILDQPIFVQGPRGIHVRNCQWAIPVNNGAPPPQYFFRNEPIVSPSGTEVSMVTNFYCTVTVEYEFVRVNAGHSSGWGGFSMCDPGVGGVDISDSSVGQLPIHFLTQEYNPWINTNAWETGPQNSWA